MTLLSCLNKRHMLMVWESKQPDMRRLPGGSQIEHGVITRGSQSEGSLVPLPEVVAEAIIA